MSATILPSIVDGRRERATVSVLDRPASLGDGFRVEIRATVWESSDVLAIPASALFQREGGWAVFVVEEKCARLRGVEIGHRTGASVEISGGLKAGERVVLFPSDKVDDGSRVR